MLPPVARVRYPNRSTYHAMMAKLGIYTRTPHPTRQDALSSSVLGGGWPVGRVWTAPWVQGGEGTEFDAARFAVVCPTCLLRPRRWPRWVPRSAPKRRRDLVSYVFLNYDSAIPMGVPMVGQLVSDKLWKIIAERGWVGFGLLGFALVLLGASGKIPFIGEIPDHITQQVLLYFGLGLILFAAVSWFTRPHEAIEPSVQAKQVAGLINNFAKNKQAYAIKITNPKTTGDGLTLTPPVTIAGNLKRLPPAGMKVWVFSEGNAHGDTVYWPQDSLNFHKFSWSLLYSTGKFSDGDTRTLRFYVVGPDGENLISAFKRINAYHAQQGGRWEGITRLTSDIIPISDTISSTLINRTEKLAPVP
jgi:hypothetical protein